MASTIVSILPLIIGSAVVPMQVILVILMLTSAEQPVGKASAFVGGMTAVRIVQGILFGVVFMHSADASESSEGTAWVVSTLLLVLGILLLITAYREVTGEEDPDAPPPRWLTIADSLSVFKALLLGCGLTLISGKLWVFTLSALSTIGEAQLGQPASTITFLIFVLLAESILLTAIALRLLAPDRSNVWLSATSRWMERNNRAIVVTVSLVFGAFFVYKGIAGFL